MRHKILLLNPPAFGGKRFIRSGYCNSVAKGGYYWPPIDLLCQSGILNARFDITVIDAVAERLSARQVLDRIRRAGPFIGTLALSTVGVGFWTVGAWKGDL